MAPPKKIKVVSQDDFEAELKSTPQVFDATGLGITLKEGGGFNIVSITLDSKGLKAGEVVVIDTAESKYEAIEKFKIKAIRLKVI